MINKTEYRERISALKDEVLKLNIDDVIEVFLSKRPDRRDMVNNPSEDGFLCPFHDDHNSNGKFTYVNKKGVGMFKCFVCGTGGNAIDFVVNLNKVGFVEAVLDIAVNFSIITKEEYKVLTNKEFTDKQVEGERKPSYRPFAPLRDTRVTNIVYYLLSQGPSLMDKNAGHLSEEDLSYLHGRGITDKEIVTSMAIFLKEVANQKKSLLLCSHLKTPRHLLTQKSFVSQKVNSKQHNSLWLKIHGLSLCKE